MPFADQLISSTTAQRLREAIAAAAPRADLSSLGAASGRLGALSLRERADLLRDALLADLPGDYASLAATVRRAHESSPTFGGWMIWPVTSAVAVKAVQDGAAAAFEDALALLAELTGLLTSEFAVRTLLRHDLDRALAVVQGWTSSPEEAVRRLASEGTRPYLPWSVRVPQIISRPEATLPVLDALYRDPSEYVRRSVANHLNDLSRHAPALAVQTAARWLAEPDPNTERLVAQALRTLVKRGDPGALALRGFTADAGALEVEGPVVEQDVVAFGAAVAFRAGIRNTGSSPARIAVDYVVHHQKANGSQSTKTFKLTTAILAPGQRLAVQREHSFRPITTRRYYPGPHAIALQVNGVATAAATFELSPGEDPA